MGLNLGGLLVGVAGGLALFVFGMTLMSSGLQTAAGERMRGLLKFFSSNRFMAVVSGAMVTAVLQSSSATTVMVIGFINAGLLSLL
ncbi:MAG: Na/Pi symporter, partial [Lentisphaeria bacterium]|nr:Na/Pi symporter [Lentisphaeria bacterium]